MGRGNRTGRTRTNNTTKPLVANEAAPELLSRDEFREGVFARDSNTCVHCGSPAKDAHHLIERRLWDQPGEEGGYFLDNGVSLCSDCHMLAEQTVVSVD